MRQKAIMMVIAFLSYMGMAAFVTQIGILISPMASYFGVSAVEMGARFSFLTAGTLTGTFIALFMFDKFSIKRSYMILYIPLLVCGAIISLTPNIHILSAAMFILGIGCGAGLSAGAVIISKTFDDNQRASMFMITDCAFSLSGFIYPGITTFTLAVGLSWKYGFTAALVCIVLILLALPFVTFPKVSEKEQMGAEQRVEYSTQSIWIGRVFLYGFLLCMYLIGQNVLMTWGPNYLIERFSVTATESNMVISYYWGAAVIGLILSSIIVMKIPPRKFMIFATSMGTLLTFTMYTAPSFNVFIAATTLLGFFTSCIFKMGIAIGSMQVKNAPPRLVTFLLLSGTIGAMIAPAVSAFIVHLLSLKVSMLLVFISYLSVFLAFITVYYKEIKEIGVNHSEKASAAH
ncbi:MFS transporter TsgA [Pluralibacter gergoviae]|uniref:MFS transporter TsgA n=1 Tax=Pluralibacter gergoviae TaxID=61647 RepID=UPI0009006572